MKPFCQSFSLFLLLLLVTDLGLVAAIQQWYTANGDRKFLIETDSKYNYLQAVDECARRNLQLIVLHNAEKNNAIVELIQSFSEKPIALWIDLHDEFNSEIDSNRSFYSVSTGEQNTFSSWRDNEPNNCESNEHCVEMVRNSDYKWNDIDCENKLHGYVCEEHHLTTSHKRNLDLRRDLTHFTLTNTMSDFEFIIQKLNEINANTRETIKNIINSWEHAVQLNENDEPEEAFEKVTAGTLQLIEDEQLSAESSINRFIALHSTRLAFDATFIDGVLSHN